MHPKASRRETKGGQEDWNEKKADYDSRSVCGFCSFAFSFATGWVFVTVFRFVYMESKIDNGL